MNNFDSEKEIEALKERVQQLQTIISGAGSLIVEINSNIQQLEKRNMLCPVVKLYNEIDTATSGM